jgi:hypothetical protein
MNPETKLQNLQMLALSKAGCLVWRVEAAGAWVGKVIHKDNQTVTLANARIIQAGLCRGGSDIIGIRPTVITQEMVGQTVGVFLADEVKTPTGRPTKEQLRFIEAVNKAGGIAGVARSVSDALELIRG